MTNYVIRPGTDDDIPFVYSTWIKSYRRTDLRPAELHARIERLLATTAAILVCTPDGAPGTIVGWACVDIAGHLHYVYVRASHRRLGIARQLVAVCASTESPEDRLRRIDQEPDPLALIVSHLTADARSIARKHPIEFRPSLLDVRHE